MEKYKKNPCAGTKRKAGNKPTKPFPNNWRSKLAKSGFFAKKVHIT